MNPGSKVGWSGGLIVRKRLVSEIHSCKCNKDGRKRGDVSLSSQQAERKKAGKGGQRELREKREREVKTEATEEEEEGE